MIYESDCDGLVDDNDLAFVRLVAGARERLEKRFQQLDDRYTPSDYGADQVYLSGRSAALSEFAASVLGAAVALEIDELASWSISDAVESNHFDALVQQVVTQRLLKAKTREKAHTVSFDFEATRELRNRIEEMKRIVEESDEAQSRKMALLKKLNALAAEVDRGRTRFDAVMAMIVEIAKTGGKVAQESQPIVSQIISILSAWHGHPPSQDQLPAPKAPRQIEDLAPPSPKALTKPRGKSFDKQLDDEIPF